MTLGIQETGTVGLRGRAGLPLPLLPLGVTAARPPALVSLFPHQRGLPGGDQTEGKGSRPGNYPTTGGERKVGFSDGVGVKVTSYGCRGSEDPRVAQIKEGVARSDL